MRRMLISGLLALVVTLAAGASTASAGDSIKVDTTSPGGAELNGGNSDGVPPPEIIVIRRNGEVMNPGRPG